MWSCSSSYYLKAPRPVGRVGVTGYLCHVFSCTGGFRLKRQLQGLTLPANSDQPRSEIGRFPAVFLTYLPPSADNHHQGTTEEQHNRSWNIKIYRYLITPAREE